MKILMVETATPPRRLPPKQDRDSETYVADPWQGTEKIRRALKGTQYERDLLERIGRATVDQEGLTPAEGLKLAKARREVREGRWYPRPKDSKSD